MNKTIEFFLVLIFNIETFSMNGQLLFIKSLSLRAKRGNLIRVTKWRISFCEERGSKMSMMSLSKDRRDQ